MGKSASFYKCALQVNPYSYTTYRGNESFNEEVYNQEMVRKCVENNISVVGLADHGRVESSQSLREALTEANITVFPGFELCTSERIHIVCLFDPDTPVTKLNQYLGAVGFSGEIGTEPSSMSCLEIGKKVTNDLNGFWYAAHVTDDNGLLYKGKLNDVWKSHDLVAAQIPRKKDTLDFKYKQMINNKDPNYKRNKPIAIINAKDVERPDNLDDHATSVLVKMTRPTFENFKSAFKDPGSRVKLNFEANETYQSCLKEMRVYGGYLDELIIPFSDNLTTIIGGRGTGKSTIINFIRYVLDLKIQDSDLQNSLNNLFKSNLGQSGKIELDIISNSQFGQSFTISRTYEQDPVIYDSKGNLTAFSPHDLLPDIEIYGQNEIIDAVADTNKVSKIISRLFDVSKENSINEELSKKYEKLKNNSQILSEKEKEYTNIMEDLGDSESNKDRLKIYKDSGLAEKLSLITKVGENDSEFTILKKNLPDKKYQVPTISVNMDSDFNYKEDVNASISKFNKSIEQINDIYRTAVENIYEEINDIEKDWLVVQEEQQKEIRDVIKSIKGEDIVQDKTPEEIVSDYKSLVEKVSGSKSEEERARLLLENIDDLYKSRRDLIIEIQDRLSEKDRIRNKQLKKVNTKKLKDKLSIDIKYRQNKSKFIEYIDSNVPGVGPKRLSVINEYENFDVFTFVNDLQDEKIDLINKYNLTTGVIDKLQKLTDYHLREIEELKLSDIPIVSLNVHGSYKRLDNLSKGQQCTAILNILLLDNLDPLLIDQPEDNLDNSFIAGSLVALLRENKISRQYIFATHNANIPVFGDAELIIPLEEQHGKSKIVDDSVGSIDSSKIKKSVIDILEGGKYAFKVREEKYGL